MENKKNSRADLQNKKGLFFQLGLAAALVLMIVVFSVNSEKKVASIAFVPSVIDVEPIPPTRDPQKPEQVKARNNQVIADIMRIVRDDARIDVEPAIFEFGNDIPEWRPQPKADKPDDTDPQYFAEIMPKFQGGDLAAFRAWVFERLRYPQPALEAGVEGKVTLSFVIERDGTLSNIEVLQSIDQSLADEAIRVLKTSPKWTPGMQNTAKVRVKYSLPVEFKLSKR